MLITGVPTNADGEPVWSSLDDLIGHPHAHGLFSCLESIAHVHQWVSMTADEFRPALPRLAPRFVATIDEAIDGSADTWNPAAWIHLGHGELEHTLKRIEGLDEWEDEEYEHIPGLSNGHEDQDYRAFRNLPVAFQRNRAIFSFSPCRCVTPSRLRLIFAQQVAFTLPAHQRISKSTMDSNFTMVQIIPNGCNNP